MDLYENIPDDIPIENLMDNTQEIPDENNFEHVSFDLDIQPQQDFFDKFSKYITLSFVIFFISLLFLQKGLINMFLSKIITINNRVTFVVIQAIFIAVFSSISSYYLT